MLAGAQLRGRGAGANVEPVLVAVADKNRRGRAFATHDKHPAAPVVLEVQMNLGESADTDPGLDYVAQVQAHLVFVGELIDLDTYRRAVVGDTDNQGTAVGVEKTGDGLERRQLDPLIRFACMEVNTQGGFKLDRGALTAFDDDRQIQLGFPVDFPGAVAQGQVTLWNDKFLVYRCSIGIITT